MKINLANKWRVLVARTHNKKTITQIFFYYYGPWPFCFKTLLGRILLSSLPSLSKSSFYSFRTQASSPFYLSLSLLHHFSFSLTLFSSPNQINYHTLIWLHLIKLIHIIINSVTFINDNFYQLIQFQLNER